jgi:thioredoxin-dependent peroxiredoxin
MQGLPVPDFSLPSTGASSLSQTFQLSQFKRAGVQVFGISRDSLKSHEGFKAKIKFPFEQFGVKQQQIRCYGKKVRGIPKGRRGVKVPGHAQEVLNFVKAL